MRWLQRWVCSCCSPPCWGRWPPCCGRACGKRSQRRPRKKRASRSTASCRHRRTAPTARQLRPSSTAGSMSRTRGSSGDHDGRRSPMKQALVVGSDDFLISAMRIALRHAPGIHALGILERGGAMRQALRDASPDLVLVEAVDTDLALTRLRELGEECPDALVILVAAELSVVVFEDAARRGMIACLAGPGLT